MMTPEGWTEGARVKNYVLGRVRGGRVGREEGPGLLTWPFVTGSLFGSLFSPTTAITDTASRALLATDFAPAPVCLDSLVPKGTKVCLLDLPSSGMPETGARWPVPGKWPRFAAPRKGRFSQGRFGDAPEGFLLPVSLPPRSDPRQAVCSGSCSSCHYWYSLIAVRAAILPPELALHFLRWRDVHLALHCPACPAFSQPK